MRVTHVITRLIVGGAQENTVATVLGLQQKPGVSVLLISGPTTGPEGSLEQDLASSPGTLILLPSLIRPVHPWKDCRALFELTRLLREQAPDIVHTHSGKAGILGRLAASRAEVPTVIHTVHGPSFGPFQGALANWSFLCAERYAARFTSHFVSVADALTAQYLQAGIGFPEQFTRVFSGFPLEPYLDAPEDPGFRRQLGLAPSDLVVGKIARLFKLKGHEDLFDVAPTLVQHCPQMKFLLIGDGVCRESFERKVRSLNMQAQFVFAGLVPPQAIPKYIKVMDLLVHLSRREGLPRALPQAMAGGRPVVAYDCGGAKEVCLDNETGFLVAAGDRSTLIQRVLQLAGDYDLRERFGRSGRELIKNMFPIERMVDQIYSLYVRLSKERGKS